MSDQDGRTFDVVVLGGGTGGYRCALRAAGLGMSVALVEKDRIGGTCLHRGCIPSKAMLHAASIAEHVEEGRRRWGIHATVEKVDPAALAAARDKVVDQNHRGLVAHLRHDNVAMLEGSATVTGPRSVRVEPATGKGPGTPIDLRAGRGLVLATGSVPRQIPGLASDGVHVLTSDEATRADTLPASVIILGGGAIGVEFASLYRAFGADVTLVEVLDRLLPGEDPDVSQEIAAALKRKGTKLMLSARLEDFSVSEQGVVATVSDAAGTREIRAEKMLVAAGRAPVSASMGLEELGVHLDRGYVVPSDWARLETSVPGVHVVGDLLPPPSMALAHASFAEGMLVAETLAGVYSPPIRYEGIPRATYSLPEASSVGLSEPEARAQGLDVVTNRFPLTGVARGLIYGQGGMVKVVAEKGGPVLGVHMVGPHVTELIAEGMLVTNWQALPAEVAELIHTHPSLSEAFGEAHLTLAGRGLHQASR